MGAKVNCLLAALLAVGTGACANAKRFAPPGIIKYEEREKGIPPNPAIAAIAAERRSDGGSFPRLAEQPVAGPTPMGEADRQRELDALVARYETLLRLTAADRAAVDNEDLAALGEALEAMQAFERADAAAAAQERPLAPVQP